MPNCNSELGSDLTKAGDGETLKDAKNLTAEMKAFNLTPLTVSRPAPLAHSMAKLLALAMLCGISASAAVTLVSNTLPQAAAGQPYNATLTAQGGLSPYVYGVQGGTLPEGLTLSGSGAISGTPTKAGSYTLSIQITDATPASATATATLRVNSPSGLTYGGMAPPAGSVGSAYDFTLVGQGGTNPYSWDVVVGSGTLPNGLTLASNGRLSGTPVSAGLFPVVLRLTDANGFSFQSSFAIQVNAMSFSISTTSLAGAFTNVPYSQTISAGGGTPPYSFGLLSGALPPGVTISSSGLISGSPTSAGTYNFFIRATDSLNASAQASFSIAVAGTGPRILISSLPTGILSQPYSGSLIVQGGTAPYIFSLLVGSLPSGLTLTSNGAISGTPSASGVFPITVRATDSAGLTAQADILVNINSSLFGFTNTSAVDGFVGQNYTFPLTLNGGSSPIVYSVLSGALPAGIVLGSNGVLSGSPTTAGTFSFVLRAIDGFGATAQVPLSIQIKPSNISIQQTALPVGQVAQPYSSTLTPVNGTAPFTFSLVSGTLPPGLTLASNGNIFGIPTTTGIYQVTFRVIDANQNSSQSTLNLLIGSTGLNINTISLPSARFATAYSTNLFASGGSLPYNFSVISGALPLGLTLSPSGLLSGTPTSTGPSNFTIRVTDNVGTVSQASYTLITNSASSFMVTPMSLPSGQLGRPFNITLMAMGGVSPYTYAVTTGALPPGIFLSSNGILSGTPNVAGNFAFNIQVTDAVNVSVSYSQAILVSASDLNIVTTQIPAVQQGVDYLATFVGAGGTAPYSFNLFGGSLPPGLTLNGNGTVTGIALATGIYPLTVRISDQAGNTATANYVFTVSGSGVLQIATSALPTARNGQAYNAAILALGGQQPYGFTLIGGLLPAGLTLSSGGLISGTPTADGTSTFTVRLVDANGASSQVTLTLNVTSSTLNLPSDTLANGRVGEAYLTTLTATGGSGSGYSFALASGTLPIGLTLSSSGILSGIPTVSGTFPVVVRVVDALGSLFQKQFTLTVNSNGLSFTNASLPIGYLGQQFRFNLQAAGGIAPYSFSISNGVLPSGLILSTSGEIAGIPQTASNSPITFRVVDSAGTSSTVTLVFNVTQSTLQFLFTSIPNAIVGQSFSFAPTASGGTGPYSFSVVGMLPSGLTLSPAGVISGVPSQEGTYNVTLRALDTFGAVVQANYALTISGVGFRISSLTLNQARVNQPFSQALTSTGGMGPVTYSLQSGNLPPGLTLSQNGTLLGVPTTAGSYTFVIRATDMTSANAVATFTLPVAAPVVIFTTTNLVAGTLNQVYSQTIGVSGGTGPYTFTVSGGSLAPGLSLSSTGVISGFPTSIGNFAFTVRATDAAGMTNTFDYLIGIAAFGAPAIGAVVDAANYAGGGVAPGEVLVIFGTNLGPANLLSFSVVNNAVPTSLGGTRVLFDGVPAPLIYTSSNQIAIVAPFNIASKASVLITVEYLGSVSAALQVPVKAVKPALFTVDASGKGAAAILNQDSTVNTQSNTARKETVVSLYLTGAGLTTPIVGDGQIVNSVANLVNPVSITINGQPAVVQYSGNAPGLIPGVAQINVKLPIGTKSGPNTIVVTIGTTATVSETTVWVE